MDLRSDKDTLKKLKELGNPFYQDVTVNRNVMPKIEDDREEVVLDQGLDEVKKSPEQKQ